MGEKRDFFLIEVNFGGGVWSVVGWGLSKYLQQATCHVTAHPNFSTNPNFTLGGWVRDYGILLYAIYCKTSP